VCVLVGRAGNQNWTADGLVRHAVGDNCPQVHVNLHDNAMGLLNSQTDRFEEPAGLLNAGFARQTQAAVDPWPLIVLLSDHAYWLRQYLSAALHAEFDFLGVHFLQQPKHTGPLIVLQLFPLGRYATPRLSTGFLKANGFD